MLAEDGREIGEGVPLAAAALPLRFANTLEGPNDGVTLLELMFRPIFEKSVGRLIDRGLDETDCHSPGWAPSRLFPEREPPRDRDSRAAAAAAFFSFAFCSWISAIVITPL